MSDVEICEIARAESKQLRGCSIELPAHGARIDGHMLRIGGWVLGQGKTVVAVSVLFDNASLRRGAVHLPRADVASAFPGVADTSRCGFSVQVGLVGLPQEFTLQVNAVFEDNSAVPMGHISVRRAMVRPSVTPQMQPLLVTNLGRSGSTLLMRILAEHPAIVAQRLHPFETRAAGYWLHMLKVLTEPANHQQSSHPNEYQHNPYVVGHHPHYMSPLIDVKGLYQWFTSGYLREAADFAVRCTDAFYQQVAIDQNKKQPAFFAEKCHPNHVPRLAWELYSGAKEIILVRDFRDTVRSMLGWFRKLGKVSFGRDNVGTDEEFIRRKRVLARRLLETWRSRPQAHLVRYEDLILRPRATVGAMLDYLGLERSPELIVQMLQRASEDSPEFESHRTTTSVRSSIGKWMEWEPVLKNVCREALDDVVREFGYELGPDGALVLDPNDEPEVPKAADVMRNLVREDATVLVVSRGDEDLLVRLKRPAWHFPRDENGVYAGHHPADSDDAIAQLEAQREQGASYLLFPKEELWWLDHYAGFREYLEQTYVEVPAEGLGGRLFRLMSPSSTVTTMVAK